jgi:glycine/D-amino acid oxidase-like deaminating enzyme
MAGILTAYFLKQQGVPYLLVEKERICSGTTGNTTAKITYQHGLIYSKILKNNGIEAAKMYLQANKTAFERLTDLCAKTECDLQYQENYVYTIHDRRKLDEEMNALQQIGYPAEYCKELPLPIAVDGAIKFCRQAQFHPLKFLAAIAKDLHIYENTFVREMVGNIAVTDCGKIYAKRVIVATHFPFLNKHGGYFLKLYQHRSYVIALENAASVSGMFVDDSKTGLSFRNYNGLLLLGGGGHRTGKTGGDWTELRRFAAQHYPKARERYHWAAQDCMSLDDVPYIGRYAPTTPELYVATGFNKWGMTGSMLAAMLLCDLMLGRKNEYNTIFESSRSMLKPQLFVNALESAANLLTLGKKRCPHLGCALKWNAAEHSWDCACHGSRFDQNGKLLENPANGDLSEK